MAINLLIINILLILSLKISEKSFVVFNDEHILLVVFSFILQCRPALRNAANA